MPPLTAVQAWLARTLLGDSPYAIHFLPALAGAALVLMTGAMVRQLGGGRWAQVIAALAAAIAPGCLAFDAYLSMNSIDLVLVAGLAMILIRIVQTGDARLLACVWSRCRDRTPEQTHNNPVRVRVRRFVALHPSATTDVQPVVRSRWRRRASHGIESQCQPFSTNRDDSGFTTPSVVLTTRRLSTNGALTRLLVITTWA